MTHRTCVKETEVHVAFDTTCTDELFMVIYETFQTACHGEMKYIIGSECRTGFLISVIFTHFSVTEERPQLRSAFSDDMSELQSATVMVHGFCCLCFLVLLSTLDLGFSWALKCASFKSFVIFILYSCPELSE